VQDQAEIDELDATMPEDTLSDAPEDLQPEVQDQAEIDELDATMPEDTFPDAPEDLQPDVQPQAEIDGLDATVQEDASPKFAVADQLGKQSRARRNWFEATVHEDEKEAPWLAQQSTICAPDAARFVAISGAASAEPHSPTLSDTDGITCATESLESAIPCPDEASPCGSDASTDETMPEVDEETRGRKCTSASTARWAEWGWQPLVGHGGPTDGWDVSFDEFCGIGRPQGPSQMFPGQVGMGQAQMYPDMACFFQQAQMYQEPKQAGHSTTKYMPVFVKVDPAADAPDPRYYQPVSSAMDVYTMRQAAHAGDEALSVDKAGLMTTEESALLEPPTYNDVWNSSWD